MEQWSRSTARNESPEAESATDSGSGRAVRDSGIAPAGTHLESLPPLDAAATHAELALADCTRLEGSLGAVLRGLEHLTNGARAAQTTIADLTEELANALEALHASRSENLELQDRLRYLETQAAEASREARGERERVQLLEAQVADAKRNADAERERVQLLEAQIADAKRDTLEERERFIQDEDAFLHDLLTEHERETRRLRHELEQAEHTRLEALERAEHIEREALQRADRVEREALRRAERAELEALEAVSRHDRPTLPPPAEPPPATGSSESARIGAVKLRSVRIPLPRPMEDDGPDAASESRTPSSAPPRDTPHHTEETFSEGEARRKPTSALRSRSGSYSLKAGEVREELIRTGSASGSEEK